MRSPGQHMSIKIRCRFRKCGQGGGRGWFRGEGGPLGRRTRGPPSPRAPPSSPQRAFFRRMDGWCGAADCAPLMVPRYCGRGAMENMAGCPLLPQDVGSRSPMERGREEDDRCPQVRRFVPACGAGHQRGRGGRSAVRRAPCAGTWKAGEDTRGRGDFPPETAGGGRRAIARHDAVAPGIDSAMASPSPLIKELSSRSIPGRWPCP